MLNLAVEISIISYGLPFYAEFNKVYRNLRQMVINSQICNKLNV
jgi:hypothetical protein